VQQQPILERKLFLHQRSRGWYFDSDRPPGFTEVSKQVSEQQA